MDVSRRLVVVFLALLLGAHVLAVFFDWYSNPAVDSILHLLGGIWSAFFFILLFGHFVSLHLHHHFSEKAKILIIIASFASMMGVLWVLHQYVLSEYFSFYLQESIGQVVSGLLMTIIGGFVGGWIGIRGETKKMAADSHNV